MCTIEVTCYVSYFLKLFSLFSLNIILKIQSVVYNWVHFSDCCIVFYPVHKAYFTHFPVVRPLLSSCSHKLCYGKNPNKHLHVTLTEFLWVIYTEEELLGDTAYVYLILLSSTKLPSSGSPVITFLDPNVYPLHSSWVTSQCAFVKVIVASISLLLKINPFLFYFHRTTCFFYISSHFFSVSFDSSTFFFWP